MPAKQEPLPPATLHLSVFLRGGTRRTHVGFHTEPIPLTPARVKLLAKLVPQDQWRRTGGSKRSSLDEVQAALMKALERSS